MPAGGSQQTLPFTGLIIPSGVAVDAAGDAFVTAQNNPAVVELHHRDTVMEIHGFGSNP